MKIEQLDGIMLMEAHTGPSSNRPQSTTALLRLVKRCFPWRRPRTKLGPPTHGVVCACHRCAGSTQPKGLRGNLRCSGHPAKQSQPWQPQIFELMRIWLFGDQESAPGRSDARIYDQITKP
ncbi:hypothetical protein T07_5416 [Trichinella nelsoni]|uniref:Uncharacterized protein n=1 Tax=Trichinella nelsoni TaxID=6336 RepID=A0A0V0RLM9_9BILA|nr:hypothetical protein T07_5416 [Trichinella nelsoni]